jgi:hypothetical protein
MEYLAIFFDSNFLQTVSVVILGYLAHKISKLQQESADTVELHAYHSLEGNESSGFSPYIRIQNVGTRLVYLTNYLFNGKKYILNKQVLPTVYSNAAANYYWVQLPTNGENHVMLEVFFCDSIGRKYSSEIIANKVDGFWNVSTSPSKHFGRN